MASEGRQRVIIERVKPEIDCGRFPIKRVIGERVVVRAGIFTDGHDRVAAALLYRHTDESEWRETRMKPLVNDEWEGAFTVEEKGIYYYTLQAWVDHFQTWQKDLQKKSDARQDVTVDLLTGAQLIEQAAKRISGAHAEQLNGWAETLKKAEGKASSKALSEELLSLMDACADRSLATTYGKELAVVVDRKKALFSSWYEFFPRSLDSKEGKHSTLRDSEKAITEIARMGFDVIYLPPIHPIGETNRKGKNNSPVSEPDEPGSPWAIGSKEGGHLSVNPMLGTMEDFERFVKRAKDHQIDVAIDIAFQASPDHPYVKEHPEWFKWRPDGTVQYAENPPKKYQDVLPFNFETDNWQALWEELKSVFLFWIEKGVHIFRVDNPHTKPIAFWEWVITEIKREHPDTIFLSEAFTRPKVMYRLAKVGFTQSYTYFTWRNAKPDLTEYLTELLETEVREYFRPNFWPNTPDILPEFLQFGGRPAFVIRLVLAATLSSNYGIYGPAYELIVHDALDGKEEYLDSEKYEIKQWNWDREGNLKDFIARLNRIRKTNAALQTTWNLKFYETDNKNILFYGKTSDDLSNVLLIAVTLDPFHIQSGTLKIPLEELGIDPEQPFLAHDLLSGDKFMWQGESNFIELNPHVLPAHIFRLRTRMRREKDFDYFM
ncbi:MAG: alpha-1,4-glucan--maltose-1-phosphate maltosyltransferase [Blastocatellia bacterium]|nr:alpha-1,4-glucan--maltose-1-phosphate maltosyltransferase [Blastocatellia bacterium]